MIMWEPRDCSHVHEWLTQLDTTNTVNTHFLCQWIHLAPLGNDTIFWPPQGRPLLTLGWSRQTAERHHLILFHLRTQDMPLGSYQKHCTNCLENIWYFQHWYSYLYKKISSVCVLYLWPLDVFILKFLHVCTAVLGWIKPGAHTS